MHEGEGDQQTTKIRLSETEVYDDEYPMPKRYELLVAPGQDVREGADLFRSALKGDTNEAVQARMSGQVLIDEKKKMLMIRSEETEQREYQIPHSAQLEVRDGERVSAGQPLTRGPKNPQEILHILGREAVQRYLVDEVQKVYHSQGVNVHDKHIEVIVRQMLRKVRIDTAGDTEMLPGEMVERFAFAEVSARTIAAGGEASTATPVLLGITKASLSTNSFLSAASFQETTRVLTEAAINGQVDRLRGLKENVIIGKLIPAGSGTTRTAHQPGDYSMVSIGQNIDDYLRASETFADIETLDLDAIGAGDGSVDGNGMEGNGAPGGLDAFDADILLSLDSEDPTLDSSIDTTPDDDEVDPGADDEVSEDEGDADEDSGDEDNLEDDLESQES